MKRDAYDHSVWNDVTVSKAVRAVPGSLEDQPLFLFIDDTMVEKSGKHFELCSKLYDHAAHNGSKLPQWTLYGQSPALFSDIPGWENPLSFCSVRLPALG